jgi:hypothetical protein
MTVPYAYNCRHWSVFSASIATVLVFWGLTPTQAGIFATTTVNQTFTVPMAKSTGFLSLDQQRETLSAESVYSATNILWLDESLPPYMTRDFLLAPFGPTNDAALQISASSETWTSVTERYGVNTTCETPIPWISDGVNYINSTWGCHFPPPPPRTISDSNNTNDVFDTLYIGYSNDDGSADYYLSLGGICPKNETSTFIIQWSKALISGTVFNSLNSSEQAVNANTTTRWCRSTYYAQDVQATIALPKKNVLSYHTLGDPRPLPSNIFNTSDFEAAMSMGHDRNISRLDFPTVNWPNQQSFLLNLSLNLEYLPKMAPFAIGATQLPMDDYLNPAVLDESYQAAYRILFSRQMVNVLSPNLDPSSVTFGERRYVTQAIVLVPAFTYVVEAFLATVILLAASLCYWSFRRPLNLQSDPSTISAAMSLVSDDEHLLSQFKRHDRSSNKEMDEAFSSTRFQLLPSQASEPGFRLTQYPDFRSDSSDFDMLSKETQENLDDTVKGVQPTEFKLKTGVAFFVFQLGLFVTIPTLYYQITLRNGKSNSSRIASTSAYLLGFSLPTQNQSVRQLLENYLPTAIGTFIEPFWLVLNRHLCMLQPFDSLRMSKMRAKDSIGLDYSSRPPQFVIINALRRGHILLAAVCCMTLLANVLSVALSGLFFENSVLSATNYRFSQPYDLHFEALDGAGAPFIEDGGGVMEPFYIAMSNITAQTDMPPWTDDRFFYLPFSVTNPQLQNETWSYHSTTPALGANLTCQQLSPDSRFSLLGIMDDQYGLPTVSSSANLTINLHDDNGAAITCVPKLGSLVVSNSAEGPAAFELNLALTGPSNSSRENGDFCREHLAAGWIRAQTAYTAAPYADYPQKFNISSYQSNIIICRAALQTGLAEVVVASDGHVKQRLSFRPSNDSNAISDMFTTTASDLIGQVHQFTLDKGLQWHTDSLPSDFNNWLIEKTINSTKLLDPNLPPPSFDEVVPPFSNLYSTLFAILVSRNTGRLLQRSNNATTDGVVQQPDTRIFMSQAMLVIAETILGLYIIVTICLYVRRPWRVLARMPHTPASVIAFFAAGHAIEDHRDTVHMTSTERREHLKELDNRYGFGTFIGTDKKTHVGVEKHPFLAPLTREQSELAVSVSGFKVKAGSRWRFLRWNSGKIREGGYI